VWSNNEYKAPEHRVRASTESERYSAPFFYNPSYETVVTPIITERTGRREPDYDPISYRYFRQQRFKGDFADAGKEIQIEDFRRS
jgi:isopenicillin N synthase-like dioxygenase